MSGLIKNIIKYVVSVGLAGLLFYLVFRNVDIPDFLARISQVNFWWVVLSVLLAVLSHWLRAYRWNLLLQPLGYELKTHRTFLAVMSGYLANLALPRLGEVTRCGVLKRLDGVSMSTALGSVVTDRILDFAILLFLIFLDFVIEFDKIYQFFMDSIGWERFDNNKMIYLSLGIGLFVFGVLGLILVRQVLKKDFTNPVLKKTKEILGSLIAGITSIKGLSNVPGFILSTIGIWISYFLMSYVIFFSMSETSDLTLAAGLSILAAAGVAMATPVQGGIGAYHALVSGVLIIYGVADDPSLFFATLLHTSQVIFIMTVGGACFVIASFISRKKPTDATANA